MTLYDDAEAAAEDLNRLANALTQVDPHGRNLVDRIRDSMQGHPRAQAYDTERSSGRLWCWQHEQDLHQCHSDDLQCRGEALSGPSDPTGEAGVLSDRAAADMKRLTAIFAKLRSEADAGIRIANAYTPRPPSEHERSRTADENDPHCESCSRVEIAKGVDWWVAPHTNGSGHYRTTVGDTLTEAMWLCQWCRDHTMTRGCLPSKDELEQHRDGKRIRCPHPEKQAVA